MQINIDNYPSIIAVPYKETLSDNIQRKEYQRICLEMILSFIAVTSLSNYYSLKKSDQGNKLDSLNLDLGQMSIGKWNAVTRTTSKILKEGSDDIFLKDIYELYHGSKKNEWNNAVDELIQRRNKDAHGGIISATDLPGELQQRQEMLDKLMGLLSFLKDYRLLIPYDDEVKEGNIVYICKSFLGDEEHIEYISNSVYEMDKYRPYLYNILSGRSLNLTPMVVSHPESEETLGINLFVYSKTLNKKSGSLHFSNWNSSKDFLSHDKTAPGDFFAPDQVCNEFRAFRIFVEDESLISQKQPSIVIKRNFRNKTLSIGEITSLSVFIENKGDADAEDIEAIFDFPLDGFIRVDSEENKLEQDAIKINLPSLTQGESWEDEFYFKPIDSGQYEFGPLNLFYNYVNVKNETINADVENGINFETSPSLLYEVFDPNDPESQIPIININMSYDNEAPQIGDKVTLTIDVKNIGRSVANDVKINILPPKNQVELLSGSPDWKGTLNPGQSLKSQFILLPKTHGVFSMKMRDIVYRNQMGDLFKTLAYEDYKILIRNNPKVKYRFLMETIWEDLELDSDEKAQVELFARQYDIHPEEKQNIESEVKIKTIKKILKDITNRGDFKIKEMVREGKHAFCLGPCPFMIIDFSDMQNIKLLFKGDFKGSHFSREVISWRLKFREVAFSSISLNALSNMGGSGRLKGMINQSIRWVEQHDHLLVLLAVDLSELLCIPRESIDIQMMGGYVTYQFSPEVENTFNVSGFFIYFDSKNYANIIANYPRSSGIGSQLREAGYQFFTKNDLNSEQPFGISERTTTFVQIESQKIDKHNRSSLINKIPNFILTCIDFSNSILFSDFKKDSTVEECLEFIGSVMDDRIGDVICKINKDEKIITYYSGHDFPVFRPGQDFLQVNVKKNKVIMTFRFLSREIYEELNDNVKIKRDSWPYEIEYSADVKAILAEAIIESSQHVGSVIQELSYGILKSILENGWIGNFDLLLNELLSIDEMSFQEWEQLLLENDMKTKIKHAARGIKRFFLNQQLDSPVEINFAAETISIKKQYFQIISDALENYKLNINEEVLAFHDFKQLISTLNNEYASMSYLTRAMLPRTIISSKNFKTQKGIYFDVTLRQKQMAIRVSLSIKDNPYASEVKKCHEKLMDQGQQCYIKEKELCIASVKGGGENSYKIFLELHLKNIEQLKDVDWVNNFVSTYNEFTKLFLSMDYDQLKLNRYDL